MPTNKRESFIYSVLMCFTMVFWMSNYNVALQMGGVSGESIAAAWMGMPAGYIVAFLLDWFVVSGPAKAFAFRFLAKPDSSIPRKVLSISTCMVVPMVFFMSLYGACEMCIHTGAWSALPMVWLTNIPKNFIMALPLQIIVAGPLVRKVFRTLFPIGSVK